MKSQQMRSKKVVNFISGHLDITQAEFEIHYRPLRDRSKRMFCCWRCEGCSQVSLML